MSAQGIIVGLQTLHVVGATKYCEKYCPHEVYEKVLSDRNKSIKESVAITLVGIVPVPVCTCFFIYFLCNNNESLAIMVMLLAIVLTILLLLILSLKARNSTFGKTNQWGNFLCYYDNFEKDKSFDMNIDYRELYKNRRR